VELLDWDERGGGGAGAVYIYYITTTGNSVSSQLGSSCQASRYGTEKAGGMSLPSRTESHLPGHYSQPGGPPYWASPLVFRWGGGVRGWGGDMYKVSMIWATCWVHSFLSKAIYNLSTFSVQVVEPTSCMVQINIYNIIGHTSPPPSPHTCRML
jgi:hypothetical protein